MVVPDREQPITNTGSGMGIRLMSHQNPRAWRRAARRFFARISGSESFCSLLSLNIYLTLKVGQALVAPDATQYVQLPRPAPRQSGRGNNADGRS